MSSLWQRLRSALAPSPPKDEPRRGAPTPPVPEGDAQRIMTYARRIGPLDERPARCDREILEALARLWQSGHEDQAVQLGAALASALPHDAQLQLTLAERLCIQRDYRRAKPLLARALDSGTATRSERLRAHFLLHEAAHAEDQVEAAVTHLTQVLAEDLRYPGALTRLLALRPQTAPRTAQPEALLLAGGPDAPASPTLLGLPGGPGARYQLLRELGCGSAGVVYLALDSELQCEVALKVFYPRRRDAAGEDEALLRALHEARLIASVRHPGVIALYDLSGELPGEPGGPGGPPRLAMELCRGGSLRARLHSGPLPPRSALLRAGELLDTLAAVHQTGVVHGDLKPENLLFRGPELHRAELPKEEAQLGDLVLSDFGLARLGHRDDGATAGLGTVGYAAPEQLAGAGAEPASDVYAAGVVLLEMLSGERTASRSEALHGGSPLSQLPQERWAAVAQALGGAGPALRQLLQALLSREPQERPTAAEALGRLAAIAAELSEASGGSS